MQKTKNKIARFKAFWARENHDRPIVGFTESYFPRGTIELLNCPDRQIHPEDVDIPAFLAQCDQLFERWNECTGDAIWSASPLWGLPWIRAILGFPIYVGKDTIWGKHKEALSYEQIHRACDLNENRWLDLLLELGRRLSNHAKTRYPLGTICDGAPFSFISELRGLTDFAFDFVDCPEQVEKALFELTQCYTKVLNLYFDQLAPWHGGYGSGTRFIWTPGRLVEYDEDSNYLVSPQLHRKFVLPCHHQVVKNIEFAYLHLHSGQLHTLDNLLEDNQLVYYELCPDVGYDMGELIAALRKILRHRCVIVHAFFTAEQMAEIIESVPPQGLCILGRADTPEHAAELYEQVLGNRGWQ